MRAPKVFCVLSGSPDKAQNATITGLSCLGFRSVWFRLKESRAKRRAGFGLAALALVTALQSPAAQGEVLHLTPDEALMTARAAYLAGEIEVAAHIARAVALAQPTNPWVHLLLAAAEPKLGHAQAGLQAGRQAWKLAGHAKADRPLRYEIARNTARAALDAGRPLVAQLWLRRSLDVAPDAAAFATSGKDLALVRNRTPWRLQFDMEAGPSDNLNGGAESAVFRIGDYVLGTLANGAEAVSGSRASLRFRAERALPGSATAQTVLSFAAETTRNHIDAAARAKAGSLTSRDLDQSRLAFGLRRDLRLGAGEIPVSLSVEAGQNWAGGQALGPSLTLAMQGAVLQLDQGTVWLGGSFERSWQPALHSKADLTSLSLVGEQQFGQTQVSAALRLEAARSGHENSTYNAADLSLHISPDWHIGGARVTMGLSAGVRDYEAFSLIGGAVAVTGGRQDHSLGASLDLSLSKFSVMGFAPVLSLRHGKTRSNISRYETTTSGISLGIASVF